MGETLAIVSGAVWQAASPKAEIKANAVAMRLEWLPVEFIGLFPRLALGGGSLEL
ncbi:hypothetical protein [Aliihoeflea sp. PC F10.4]